MSVTSGDVLRVVVSMLWTDGNVIQNIFNAVVTGGGSPWDDADIVGDAGVWVVRMYDNLTAQCSDELDGSQIQVYKYDSIDDDWDEVGSSGFTWNASNVAEQVARGVAGLINLKTSDPDVSGKKYIGGLTEGGSTDGLWTAGIISSLLAFAIDWYTGFVGTYSLADWAPGIWSPTDTVFKLAGTSTVIPSIPAYQRRRKRGVGI